MHRPVGAFPLFLSFLTLLLPLCLLAFDVPGRWLSFIQSFSLFVSFLWWHCFFLTAFLLMHFCPFQGLLTRTLFQLWVASSCFLCLAFRSYSSFLCEHFLTRRSLTSFPHRRRLVWTGLDRPAVRASFIGGFLRQRCKSSHKSAHLLQSAVSVVRGRVRGCGTQRCGAE